MAKTQPLKLSDDDRAYLESVTRARTMQAQTIRRAKMLLLKADGESVDAIADKLDLNRNSVLLCLRKHKEGGVENALTRMRRDVATATARSLMMKKRGLLM